MTRLLRSLAVGSIVVVTACGGGSDTGPSTTVAATTSATTLAPSATTGPPATTTVDTTSATVAPTTLAPSTVPPTTIPASPWHEVDASALTLDLSSDTKVIRPQLLGGRGSILVVGQDVDGGVLTAISDDDGESWSVQREVSNVPSETGGLRLDPVGATVDVDGTWHRFRPAQLQPADSGATGVTERLQQTPDGTWSVVTPDVAGLSIDTRILSQRRYIHDAPTQIVRLDDGSFVGVGFGAYWKSFATGDQTPWLGRSLDGNTWTTTPMDHRGNDRYLPSSFADGPAGPVMVGEFTTDDGTHLKVWTITDGLAPIFDAHTEAPVYGDPTPDLPKEESFSVDTIVHLGDSSQYAFLIGGVYHEQRGLRLLTSQDGVTWQFEPVDLDGYSWAYVYGFFRYGDEWAVVANARPPGEEFGTPVMFLGEPGAWRAEPIDELAHLSVLSVTQSPSGAIVVLAQTSSAEPPVRPAVFVRPQVA